MVLSLSAPDHGEGVESQLLFCAKATLHFWRAVTASSRAWSAFASASSWDERSTLSFKISAGAERIALIISSGRLAMARAVLGFLIETDVRRPSSKPNVVSLLTNVSDDR